MPRDAEGWYQAWSPTAHAGTRYQYRINDELVVPDPASFFQPDDVDKPSEVINISALRDGDPYLGRPW
ncbi:1,4-alpha-glucan branching enzyme [Bradyrhizobium sp. S3.9.1]